jgi:hypothetical protein
MAIIIALIPALAAAQTCEDDATFAFVLDKDLDVDNDDSDVTCAWLTKSFKPEVNKKRKDKYCAYGNVKFGCQKTCVSCAETCADKITNPDNTDFTFILDIREPVVCTWLTDNYKKVESRQAKYCSRGAEVGTDCPESCGFCPVVTPTPSAPNGAPVTGAPTKSPTSAPAIKPTNTDKTPSANPTRPPSCADDAYFSFNLDKDLDEIYFDDMYCTWLTENYNKKDKRIAKYCDYGSVKFGCQKTCESCAETCADSSTFTFNLDTGASVDCAWLADNYFPNPTTPNGAQFYCHRGAETPPTAGFEVGAECPEACRFCPNPL